MPMSAKRWRANTSAGGVARSMSMSVPENERIDASMSEMTRPSVVSAAISGQICRQ